MAAVKFPLFPSLDLSNFDLSKITIPNVKLPKINVPRIDVTKINRPEIDTDAVANLARDTAYVAIGLAVVAVQKAQVRRRELAKSVSEQLAGNKPQLDEIMASVEARLATIDEHIESLEGKLDEAVTDLKGRLPEPVGAMLVQAHDLARSARKQVRSRIVTAA